MLTTDRYGNVWQQVAGFLKELQKNVLRLARWETITQTFYILYILYIVLAEKAGRAGRLSAGRVKQQSVML